MEKASLQICHHTDTFWHVLHQCFSSFSIRWLFSETNPLDLITTETRLIFELCPVYFMLDMNHSSLLGSHDATMKCHHNGTAFFRICFVKLTSSLLASQQNPLHGYLPFDGAALLFPSFQRHIDLVFSPCLLHAQPFLWNSIWFHFDAPHFPINRGVLLFMMAALCLSWQTGCNCRIIIIFHYFTIT